MLLLVYLLLTYCEPIAISFSSVVCKQAFFRLRIRYNCGFDYNYIYKCNSDYGYVYDYVYDCDYGML